MTSQYFVSQLLSLQAELVASLQQGNSAVSSLKRHCVSCQLPCMLQACYPAEVGSNPFMWADRSNSTTQVEFDLAQRQAEAISELYARLNTHVSDSATSDTAGAVVARSAALHVQRRLCKTNYTVLRSIGCCTGKLSDFVGFCCRKSRVQRSFCR